MTNDKQGRPRARKETGGLDGFVLVNKSKGLTSFDVIRRLRKILNFRKMGHTGTLDPNATGLLPISLGRATRLNRFLLSADKRYRARIRLGRSTDTYDAEGKTVGESVKPPELTADELESILDRFRGTFLQRPPLYSAKKIDGKRLYQYAREGKAVEPEEYRVQIHSLEVVDRGQDWIELEIASSSGMYVRSLANDIGVAAGCGAYLEELARLEVGGLELEDAATLEEIEEMESAGDRSFIRPMANLLPDFPIVQANSAQVQRILNGNPIVATTPLASKKQYVRIVGPGERLIAIGLAGRPLGSAQIQVQPKVVLGSYTNPQKS